MAAIRTRKPSARNGRKSAARSRSQHPYRWFLFGPALGAGPAGWLAAGRLLAGPGLLAFIALAVMLVPPVMLALVTAPGSVPRILVPVPVRKWLHNHDWRTGWRYPMPHPKPSPLLRRMVFAADRGRCVGCGATAGQVKAFAAEAARLHGRNRIVKAVLELDHYFPFSLGGLLIFWNLFLLCSHCNIVKSNAWEFDSGRRVYRGFPGDTNHALAFAILDAERRLRHNPLLNLLRCLRAAWAM